MLTYFVTAALAVGAAILAGRQRASAADVSSKPRTETARFFAVVAGAVLVVVAALRWRVGVDYGTYTNLYVNRYVPADLLSIRPWEEPGIVALTKAGALFHDDYAMMFALASVITVGLMVRTLYRDSETFGYAVLLLIVVGVWQDSFNGIRQFLACAILFAGHRLILERRFRAYLVVVAAAALFHISALLALLLYWLPRGRMGFLRAVALIGVAAILVSAYDQLGEIFSWVKQDDVTEGSYFSEEVNALRIAAAFAPVVAYLAFTDKSMLRPAEHFWVNVVLVNAAIMLASAGSAYVARFAIYTTAYLPLALPVIWKARDRYVGGLLVILTVIGYSVFWYLETSTEPALYNFQWIFDR